MWSSLEQGDISRHLASVVAWFIWFIGNKRCFLELSYRLPNSASNDDHSDSKYPRSLLFQIPSWRGSWASSDRCGLPASRTRYVCSNLDRSLPQLSAIQRVQSFTQHWKRRLNQLVNTDAICDKVGRSKRCSPRFAGFFCRLPFRERTMTARHSSSGIWSSVYLVECLLSHLLLPNLSTLIHFSFFFYVFLSHLKNTSY